MLAQQNKFLIQSNSRDGREFNLAWKNPRRRRDFSRVVNARGEEFVLFFLGMEHEEFGIFVNFVKVIVL